MAAHAAHEGRGLVVHGALQLLAAVVGVVFGGRDATLGEALQGVVRHAAQAQRAVEIVLQVTFNRLLQNLLAHPLHHHKAEVGIFGRVPALDFGQQAGAHRPGPYRVVGGLGAVLAGRYLVGEFVGAGAGVECGLEAAIAQGTLPGRDAGLEAGLVQQHVANGHVALVGAG